MHHISTPVSTLNRMRWLLYTVFCFLADTLDTLVFAFVVDSQPTISFQPSEVDDLNDQEILKRLNMAKLIPSGHSVLKLSPSTIAKFSQDVEKYDDLSDASEANALQLVFTKTTIPVPRLRRVVNCKWIIEDYIPGNTLAEAWPNYSIWRKLCVAFTLRRYVRQLRRLKASPLTPPGPISVEGPRICESPVFGTIRNHRGPFASYADLAEFFSKRAEIAFRYAKLPENHPQRSRHFDDSEALVFT
ncbi:hypothetical protein EV360DRAFT_58552, partial [Lentinula raphanica]